MHFSDSCEPFHNAIVKLTERPAAHFMVSAACKTAVNLTAHRSKLIHKTATLALVSCITVQPDTILVRFLVTSHTG